METRKNQAKGKQAKTDYSYGHAVEMELPDCPAALRTSADPQVRYSTVVYQDQPIPRRNAAEAA